MDIQSDTDESDHVPLVQKTGPTKDPQQQQQTKTTTKYYARTNPKRAGKPNMIDITNKIEAWTAHTITLKSGKVLRKSDVYKHL